MRTLANILWHFPFFGFITNSLRFENNHIFAFMQVRQNTKHLLIRYEPV